MQPTTIQPIEQQPQRHILRKLIIAIFIVAIIAAATVLVVIQVRHTNLVNTVRTELIKQNKAIKASAVNNVYTQTLPKSVGSTNTVKIDAKVAVTGVSYCIVATSLTDAKVIYHMNEKTPEDAPVSGDCTSSSDVSAPTLPGDVAVASTGATDITLTWTSSLYATGYIAECATDNTFTAGLHTQKTSDLSMKIENLSGDTLFYCHVAGTNQQGQSAWSATVQARTNLYSQPPANMKVGIVSSTELSYAWDAVPGAQYYMLQYTTDINFMNDVTTVRVTSTSGSIKGLQPYTGYFFRAEAVTAQFDQSHAAYSSPAFARTQK